MDRLPTPTPTDPQPLPPSGALLRLVRVVADIARNGAPSGDHQLDDPADQEQDEEAAA